MNQKFTLLGFVIALISNFAFAQTLGDTLTVSSHVNTHMNWFKNYNEETTFPTTGTFKKIIMEYKLGCPSGGCSDWDYTTQINVINPTGVIDSTLKQAPSFKVDGSQVDTLYYSTSQTFVTSFNNTTNSTDTVPSDTLEVILYGDTLNPTTPTDTLYVFDANYDNFNYDTNGVSTDTNFIAATDTLYKVLTPYYDYFEVKDKIELGRVITPYANGFSTTWSRTYLFEVTEFSDLLKGVKDIQAHYSGWSDGFTATIDFHFIYGTPPRDLVNLFPLWHGSPKYGEHIDGVHTIENFVNEKSYSRSGATYSELTFTPTGHGFGGGDNPENCAEFCAKTIDVFSNGTNVGQKLMWKDDCGENVLAPQPGTWLYNRANWCPGEQVPKFNFDLTPNTTDGDNTIDVDFQSYNSTNGGSYTVDGYITTYGDFNFQNNLAIQKILAPSDDYEFSKFNPTCGAPIIKIKNLAGENLTKASFEYGVEGEFTLYYYWEGNLSPLQEEVITLPVLNPIDYNIPGSKTFFVRAYSVNEVADEDITDNFMKNEFEVVKDLPNDFRVILKTNSAGQENAWSITNMNGDVLYGQTSPTSNQTHETDINLTSGCYKFEITDTDGDGLSFWNNSDGSGSIRFRKAGSNQILKSFNANFGSKIEYYFTVGHPLATAELAETKIEVTPNPSNGHFSIELPENNNINSLIVLDITGREIKSQKVNSNQINLEITDAKSGIYFIEFLGGSKPITKKVVVTK